MSECDGDTRRGKVGDSLLNDEFSRLTATALYSAFEHLSMNCGDSWSRDDDVVRRVGFAVRTKGTK